MTEEFEKLQKLAKAIGATDLVMIVLPKLQKESYTVVEIMSLLARAKNEYYKKLGVDQAKVIESKNA